MKDNFTKELYPDETILWTDTKKNGKSEMWIGLIFMFAFFAMIGWVISKFSPMVEVSHFALAAGVIMIGVLAIYHPMFKNGGFESYAITNKRIMVYGYTNVELSQNLKRGEIFSTETGCISYFFENLSFTESNDETYRISLENDTLVLYHYDRVEEMISSKNILEACEILKKYIGE